MTTLFTLLQAAASIVVGICLLIWIIRELE